MGMTPKTQGTPFDDSAKVRLIHMGLLTESGQVNRDAVGVLARVYAGLYFDALSDAGDDKEWLTAACADLIRQLRTVSPRQLFLSICVQHDYLHMDIPEPMWRLSGNPALVEAFSEDFVRRLREFLSEGA